MSDPIVFGATYSVYTRIVRLALEEKGVPYRLDEIDIFAEGGPPAEYSERHPFKRIPAFDHDGFRLYETGAISRYIDETFAGRSLMPDDVPVWTRANQIISILDSYAYRTWVWDIFVEGSERGDEPDKDKIAAALPLAETCLSAIETLMEGEDYFLGTNPTLADLQAAPMIALLRLAPEGNELLNGHVRWLEWWARINDRPSMAATRFPREE